MAWLHYIRGDTPLQYWPGDIELQAPETVIGRSLGHMAEVCGAAVAVFLDCSYLARAHARFTQQDDAWHIEDLRTPNSTYVNGVETVGRVRLRDGDEIRVPGFWFVFRDPKGGGAESPIQALLQTGGA